VTGCCNPRGCDEFFGDGFARRVAKRYRKRGVDKTARRMVEFLAGRGLEGASVLEIGGGVGDIQLELLARGAARTTNLELSDGYEAEATRLAREAGVEERIERRRHDIAVDPGGVEPFDVVVLHRVVCCYPDYQALLGAAASHTRRVLVFSHPVRNPVSRMVVGGQNLFFRLRGSRFRVFVHPPEAMRAVLAEHGLQPAVVPGGRVWRIAAGTRGT
jgi:magnesium-protoporphyrin O-methyltransferase